MNQIIADKMKREVMVVPNTALFTNTVRESKVYANSETNFEEKILNNFEFMVRWQAEENTDYKQPITYAIVMNEKKEIFVYTRGDKNSAAWDKRLHEKLSIWVGGHLEREDEDVENPLRDCLARELEEEILLKSENITEITPIGYINDDRNEVWEVHIWVAYLVHVKDFSAQMEDGELAEGSFKSYDELKQLISSWNYNVETWTELLAPEIEKYI